MHVQRLLGILVAGVALISVVAAVGRAPQVGASGPAANWRLKGAIPPEREGASMAYDSHTGQLLLFGGAGGLSGNTQFGDLWSWDGTNWKQLHPASSPPPDGLLAYDTTTGQLVFFVVTTPRHIPPLLKPGPGTEPTGPSFTRLPAPRPGVGRRWPTTPGPGS